MTNRRSNSGWQTEDWYTSQAGIHRFNRNPQLMALLEVSIAFRTSFMSGRLWDAHLARTFVRSSCAANSGFSHFGKESSGRLRASSFDRSPK